MEFKVIEEKENPLFNRKEVKIEISRNVIPSKDEAEKLIADSFSVGTEGVKIKKIESKFGSRNFIIIANIYPTKQDKDKTEFKTKQEIEAEKKALEEAAKVAAEAKVAEEAKSSEEKAEEAKEYSGEEKSQATSQSPAEASSDERKTEEQPKEETKEKEKKE